MSNNCRTWITNLNPPAREDVTRCQNQARNNCRNRITGTSAFTFWTQCLYQVEVSRITTGPVCVINKKCFGMLYSCGGGFGGYGYTFTCT